MRAKNKEVSFIISPDLDENKKEARTSERTDGLPIQTALPTHRTRMTNLLGGARKKYNMRICASYCKPTLVSVLLCS